LEGRLTGTHGERYATHYAKKALRAWGFEPVPGRDFFHEFEFTAGVSLASGNELILSQGHEETTWKIKQDWIPLAFSANGTFDAAPVVFAGYGIQAPKTN